MGERTVEFAKKSSASACLRWCNEKCFFLTASLRPCLVEAKLSPTDRENPRVGHVDLPSVPEGLDELQPAQGSPPAGGAVFSWLANDQAEVNPAPEDPSVDPGDPLSPLEEALSAAAD
ncbi:hypothetical protein ACLKA6_001455 [Drosophila palustris]